MSSDADDLAAEARLRHRPTHVDVLANGVDGRRAKVVTDCIACRYPWPCPTARLADALEAAEKLTIHDDHQECDRLLRVYGGHDDGCPGNACDDRTCCPCECGWDATRARLAP